jgi:hypothetical protein
VYLSVCSGLSFLLSHTFSLSFSFFSFQLASPHVLSLSELKLLLSAVCLGLTDPHYECRLLVHSLFYNLVLTQNLPSSGLCSLSLSLFSDLEKGLSLLIQNMTSQASGQETAIKQETEKHDEMVRSATQVGWQLLNKCPFFTSSSLSSSSVLSSLKQAVESSSSSSSSSLLLKQQSTDSLPSSSGSLTDEKSNKSG